MPSRQLQVQVCYVPSFRLQDDLPAAAVRRMIGPDAILGVSVKTVEQVRSCWGLSVCWFRGTENK